MYFFIIIYDNWHYNYIILYKHYYICIILYDKSNFNYVVILLPHIYMISFIFNKPGYLLYSKCYDKEKEKQESYSNKENYGCSLQQLTENHY